MRTATLLGAGLVAAAGGGHAVPGRQPAAAEAENWTPRESGDPMPSAFPELILPVGNEEAGLAALCPRMLGDWVTPVKAGDGVPQKLLKARLQQGRLRLAKMRRARATENWDEAARDSYRDCLADVQAVVAELWADDPKALAPWLEELVLLGKDFERYTRARHAAGIDPPFEMNAATRQRLAAESALWKAKNPPKR